MMKKLTVEEMKEVKGAVLVNGCNWIGLRCVEKACCVEAICPKGPTIICF